VKDLGSGEEIISEKDFWESSNGKVSSRL